MPSTARQGPISRTLDLLMFFAEFAGPAQFGLGLPHPANLGSGVRPGWTPRVIEPLFRRLTAVPAQLGAESVKRKASRGRGNLLNLIFKLLSNFIFQVADDIRDEIELIFV